MDFKILGLLFSILISFGLPIGGLLYYLIKKYKIKYFFIGCLTFFVSQIILRLPFLNFLEEHTLFSTLVITSPIVYLLFYCATAGIFEEIGRYISFKFCTLNKISFKDGILFGLGHGGIEAILFVGFNNLIIYLVSSGIISDGFMGMSVNNAISYIQNIEAINIFLGGMERVFAIVFHIGLTLLILYGMKIGKRYFVLIAILIHTIFNLLPTLAMSSGQSTYIVELIIFTSTVPMLILIIVLRKKFKVLGGVLNEKIN